MIQLRGNSWLRTAFGSSESRRQGVVMPRFFRPRISQAKDLFPIIRAHLAAAAALHSLPAGLSLDLLPIVEDGLAGYEILPNRSSHTYLTIGWDERGKAVLRGGPY